MDGFDHQRVPHLSHTWMFQMSQLIIPLFLKTLRNESHKFGHELNIFLSSTFPYSMHFQDHDILDTDPFRSPRNFPFGHFSYVIRIVKCFEPQDEKVKLNWRSQRSQTWRNRQTDPNLHGNLHSTLNYQW